MQALLTDPRLVERLEGGEEPALVASRALAELAMLWFEQPGTARAVVVPVGADVDGAAVRAVLDGLRAASLFRTVTARRCLRGRRAAGGRRRRPAAPVPRARRGGEHQRVDHRGPPRAPQPPGQRRGDGRRRHRDRCATLDAHLLRATGYGLDTGERRAELDAAQKAVDDLAATIGTPETVTITLTAREGTVPLTIRNDSGGPVEVQVRLRSPKLELPGGDTLDMTLDEATTRLDIPVRTRASGSFRFDVEVTSPDGRVALGVDELLRPLHRRVGRGRSCSPSAPGSSSSSGGRATGGSTSAAASSSPRPRRRRRMSLARSSLRSSASAVRPDGVAKPPVAAGAR